MSNGIDPKFFNFVSQVAHCSVPYGISLTLYAKWGFPAWLIAAGGTLIYAVWHEYFYDPAHENPAPRGSDTEDFIFLVLGPVLSLLIGHFVLNFKL